MRILKNRGLLSILLISGIVGIGVAGIDVRTSGASSGKVYVTSAPWEKVASPNESDTIQKIPKSLAKLIARKKQAASKGKTFDLPSPWTAGPDGETSLAGKAPAPQKKTYTTASPWSIVETEKAKTKTSTPSKSQKVFSSISPWTSTKPREKVYVINKLPKPEKIFTSTSPWAQAAPIRETKMEVTKHSAVTPPNPSRIIACELRLARVSDGKVISQVSALDSYANIKRLAEVMVGRLEQESSGGPVVMVTLCNRRGTKQGGLVGREMSENVTSALKNASGFEFVRRLDLREILPTEQTLESAQDITAPRFKILLDGARYVVIGGVALSQSLTTLKSAAATTTDDDDLH